MDVGKNNSQMAMCFGCGIQVLWTGLEFNLSVLISFHPNLNYPNKQLISFHFMLDSSRKCILLVKFSLK